jgi:hypothetical protein
MDDDYMDYVVKDALVKRFDVECSLEEISAGFLESDNYYTAENLI